MISDVERLLFIKSTKQDEFLYLLRFTIIDRY